jgi:hypothetical protein
MNDLLKINYFIKGELPDISMSYRINYYNNNNYKEFKFFKNKYCNLCHIVIDNGSGKIILSVDQNKKFINIPYNNNNIYDIISNECEIIFHH